MKTEVSRKTGDLLAHLDVLCCAQCGGDLAAGENGLACSCCGEAFGFYEGIPLMFRSNEWAESRGDVTEVVRAFYEESPFPNYEEFDSVASLIHKARQGLFARLLDEQVPPGSMILECGCGTGQLSNYLSIANRTVFGTDVCLNSLRLGQEFKKRNNLRRVHFLQMNLFRPVFRPGTFPLVICNGVLHHTSDPFLGFRTIADLVKPGGYILVGLYNRYGRMATKLRRSLFRLSGNRFLGLDPNLRNGGRHSPRRRAWFMDQYRHPHESTHTLGEVMTWLEETGFRFVKSIPRSNPFQPFSRSETLFEPEPPGNRFDRLIVELGMMTRGSREGGLFIVIGRKRPDP